MLKQRQNGQAWKASTDNKVYGAIMGPTWVLSAPDGPHVGPMNLAIRVPSITPALCLDTNFILNMGEGPMFTIKMSYLHNRISYTDKMVSLYWFILIGPLLPVEII